ncbi:phage tail sheath family protein [Pseudomonas koreensis]|uniref:phage tail sheath family protein n=1 Tax=Pseudomonas koreensis TaxID=198620 RepID=UPI003F857C09
MQNIGVSVSQKNIEQDRETATAVPVFIGFTETSNRGLYELTSWKDYEARFIPAQRCWADITTAHTYMLHLTVQHYFKNGGTNCFIYAVGAYKDKDMSGATASDLLEKLCHPQVFASIALEPRITLLAMPDLAVLDTGLSTVSYAFEQAWRRVASFCWQQRNVFAVLDAPQHPQAASDCLAKTQGMQGAKYCAAYWPRLESGLSALCDEHELAAPLPASGAVAAAFQQTDRERGIWKAPANVMLKHVIKPAYHHSAGEVLFQAKDSSINVIRTLPGRGVGIWGCRTLAKGDSSWRYVQTRRLITYVETHLSEVGRFALFEPNNEITWFKLSAFFSNWLRKLWQQGGLQGATESEAFQVKVGLGESMSADDLRNGVLRVNVALAVMQPAEFIEVSLMLQLGDGETSQFPSLEDEGQ